MVNPSPFRHLPVSRRTLLGGLLGASALALAGCSGGDEPAAEAPAPSSTEIIGSTDLEVLAWTNGPTIDDNFKKRVAQFNTEMAGKFTAKINFLPYDQYWQKIQLQYAANKPFDIYYWDVQAYAHFKKDLILNQQPAIDATEMVDDSQVPDQALRPVEVRRQQPLLRAGEHPVDGPVLQQDPLRRGRHRLPRRHLDLGQGRRGRAPADQEERQQGHPVGPGHRRPRRLVGHPDAGLGGRHRVRRQAAGADRLPDDRPQGRRGDDLRPGPDVGQARRPATRRSARRSARTTAASPPAPTR